MPKLTGLWSRAGRPCWVVQKKTEQRKPDHGGEKNAAHGWTDTEESIGGGGTRKRIRMSEEKDDKERQGVKAR